MERRSRVLEFLAGLEASANANASKCRDAADVSDAINAQVLCLGIHVASTLSRDVSDGLAERAAEVIGKFISEFCDDYRAKKAAG